MGKKRKLKSGENDEYEFDPVPKHFVTAHLKNQEKRLIIILEGAQLETVKACCSLYNKYRLILISNKNGKIYFTGGK